MSRYTCAFLVKALLFCVLACVASSASGAVRGGDDTPTVGPRTTAEDSEAMSLFLACLDAGHERYLEARAELLDTLKHAQRRPEGLSGVADNWKGRVVQGAIAYRLEHPVDSESFDARIEAIIAKSWHSIVQGKPVSEPVGDECVRQMRKHPEVETLVLERLFKYNEPPHVNSGIISALGAMGTEQSLGPLLELMKADEHPSYSGVCAMAAAKISRRLGDTRAVRDIVTVYGKRPRSRGKGLPEEELQRMPPWPHVNFILALSHIGGKEVVKALEELQAAEADPVLIERLEETTQRVRKRLESQQQEKDPRDKTDE